MNNFFFFRKAHGKLKRELEDIHLDFRETSCEDVHWIELAEHRVQHSSGCEPSGSISNGISSSEK